MRKLMTALALATLVLVGAGSVAAKEKPTGEEQLAQLLEGRVAGAPQTCISISRSNNLQVIDRTALVYKDRDTLWVNHATFPDNLSRDDVLVINRLSGMQLCRLDQVTMNDLNSGFFSGVVFLQNFVPYRKVAANK